MVYQNEEKLSSFSTKTGFANAQLVTPMRKILYTHPVLGRCGAASQARDGAAPRGCPRGRVFARLTLAEPGAAGLARRQPSDLCCSAGFASPSRLPSCPHRSSMDPIPLGERLFPSRWVRWTLTGSRSRAVTPSRERMLSRFAEGCDVRRERDVLADSSCWDSSQSGGLCRGETSAGRLTMRTTRSSPVAYPVRYLHWLGV